MSRAAPHLALRDQRNVASVYMVRDITGKNPKRYREVRADQAYYGPRIASYQIHQTLRPHEIPDPRRHDQRAVPLPRFMHAHRHELLPAPLR